MRRSRVLSILFSIALAIFFLTAAVAVPILCRPFYYWQARSLELSEKTGLTETEIYTAYNEVMDYLTTDAPFGTGSLPWSENGKSHFTDCKHLFRLNFIWLWSSAACLFALVVLSYRRHITFHYLGNRSPAFWSALGLTLFFGGAAVWGIKDFNGLFTFFHQICFPGKTNWIFDGRADPIIYLLPEIFWARTGALVLALSLGGVWLTALLWGRYEKK